MIYTSEELISLITRAESYFQRLSNEDLENLLKGLKPVNTNLLENLWLLKEALTYCNELQLYNNVQTGKVYKKLLSLVAGNDVDIVYNENGIISLIGLEYYLAGETPVATNLIHGKVLLSYPSPVIGEAVVVSNSDLRIETWETAAENVVETIDFNTATGDLVVTKNISPNISTNLDGRYVLSSNLDLLLSLVFKIDYDSAITGLKNSSNTVFTTTENFIPGTTRVYLNGLRLTNNGSNDYTETGTNQITFTSPPDAGDLMIIEYIKQ